MDGVQLSQDYKATMSRWFQQFTLTFYNFYQYMNLSKINIFFLDTHSEDCSLIWICHSRNINIKINKLLERCLKIIYNNKQSPFKELPEKDNSFSI